MNHPVITIDKAKETGIDLLLEKLSTSMQGLSTAEAKRRIEQYGLNEIPEKKVNPIIKFLRYFWGPIPWMIEAAATISAVIGRWEDFYIIFALLLLNAAVGFWQEYKAGNAIEMLKKKLAPIARVLRDGRWRQIASEELVPGDIVRVRLGDIVPADIKLVEGDYLLVDESALTGESLPVEKSVSDISYSSSIVRLGEMDALVVSTGANTYFGKTTKLVEEAGTKSHFQKAIVRIGDYLIALAVSLVIVIFIVAVFRHESIPETVQFALVLTVAAIPAALPAVLSVTMAIGAIALSKKEAIVSKLVSIEEMAAVDILCSDKTGTITKNELTVGEIEPLGKSDEKEVLLLAALASREEDKDPIDDAIIEKAKEASEVAANLDKYSVIAFKPFDPTSKRTEATLEDRKGKKLKVAKGAPQVIMSLVANNDEMSKEIDERVNKLAQRGYRALGVAKSSAEGKWQYVGLIGLYDPPREDSAETIKTAQSMGIKVKMVTGDHIAIADEIAHQVGLGSNMEPPSAFVDMPDRDAETIVETADGFAEVYPEHKYRIVKLLQSKGHVVGMTGDGVNDAPALKEADAGIAVAGATDAAKSAADIVLTKPGLSVIVDAIKQSRMIFQRMMNYSIYRIAETIRVLFFITLSIIVFQFYPVTPLMIVLLALLNDVPIITIAYDNVKYSAVPERWNLRTLLGIATFLGMIGVASSFGLLYIGQGILHLNREILQSFIYLKLSVAGHLMVFVARTKGPFWSIKPAKPLLLAVVITQLVATLITVYGVLLPAMGWVLAAMVWGYALALFLVTDVAKIGLYRFLKGPTQSTIRKHA